MLFIMTLQTRYGPKLFVSGCQLLSKGATNSLSRNWIEERNDAIKIAQDSIVAAQARQALYYGRGRVPAELKVGQ